MHRLRAARLEELQAFSRALEVELALRPHPNICRLFCWACSPAEARLLLGIELCEGGSLAAALEGGHTQSWPRQLKLRVAAELASGLAALHGHEPPVVHRDLKPDNILFDAAHTCKICDLGTSRLVDASRTMTGSIGTPVFCAPEQLAHQRYGAPVDVWAAGCVLSCLMRDATLPYSPCDEGTLGQVVNGEARPATCEGSALHEPVRACCQFEAATRPTAAQLMAELNALHIAASGA